MAEQARDVINWLRTLEPDDEVGIDEGGLTLVVKGSEAYYEIGGMPEGRCDHGARIIAQAGGILRDERDTREEDDDESEECDCGRCQGVPYGEDAE